MKTENMESKHLTCITCPLGCSLIITKNDDEYLVIGNKCPRGKKYALEEITAPKRMVTTTMRLKGGLYPVVPVKTNKPIPKEKIFDIIEILADNEAIAPVRVGDVIIENVRGTGASIVITKMDLGKE